MGRAVDGDSAVRRTVLGRSNFFQRGDAMMRRIPILAASAALIGCATLPDVTVSYYAPRVDAKISATQVIACDESKKKLVSTTSAALTTAYSANTSVNLI